MVNIFVHTDLPTTYEPTYHLPTYLQMYYNLGSYFLPTTTYLIDLSTYLHITYNNLFTYLPTYLPTNLPIHNLAIYTTYL
jgi:hypothetical protein